MVTTDKSAWGGSFFGDVEYDQQFPRLAPVKISYYSHFGPLPGDFLLLRALQSSGARVRTSPSRGKSKAAKRRDRRSRTVLAHS